MNDRNRTIPLPDGRTLTVRPALPIDVEALTALYDSLSTEDRRRRFFCASRPSRAVLERFIGSTAAGGLWLIALTQDGEIVADGGYTVSVGGEGELALTVRKEWRGWLGAYLLDAILTDAADHGLPSLRADILAENRQMLTLAARRGFATIDNPDWTVVEVMIPTHGPRPSWPLAHPRRRLLIEGCGGRWPGDKEAWKEGWDVVSCAGPGARSVPACPLLSGGRCPLVEGADLVIVASQRDDSVRAALVAGHSAVGSTPPVLDEAELSAEELSSRLAQRCEAEASA